MNEVKIRKAIRNLVVAKALIEDAEVNFYEEGFGFCTGNILDHGWMFCDKGDCFENGLDELAQIFGKEIEETRTDRAFIKNDVRFYEYKGEK